MKKITTVCLLVLLIHLPLLALRGEGDNHAEEEKAAKQWLSLIDQARFEEGWKGLSGPLKEQISEKQFDFLMEKIRKPLGRAVSRSLIGSKNIESPEGRPQTCVIAIYRTSFSQKPVAHEILTLLLEDGVWKPLTYRIQSEAPSLPESSEPSLAQSFLGKVLM